MPSSSRARRMARRMRTSTSAAVAPSAATMKLAWTSLTLAPPWASPFMPSSSTTRPAAISGGLANTLPQLGWFTGWLSRRQRRASSISARTVCLGGRGEGEAGRGHDRPGREGRAAVPEAQLVRLHPHRPAHRGAHLDPPGPPARRLAGQVEHVRPDQAVGQLAAVGAGVHAHPTADGARDGHRERDPAEGGLGRAGGDAGQGRGRPGLQLGALDLDPPEALAQVEHDPRPAAVGDQHVGPAPDDQQRHRGGAEHAGQGGQVVEGLGAQEHRRRPAQPEGGQRGQGQLPAHPARAAGGQLVRGRLQRARIHRPHRGRHRRPRPGHGSPPSRGASSSARVVMSPAPRVRTRSPGWTRAATRAARAARSGS